MQPTKLSSLRIQPVKAYLTRKMDVLSENDPYVVFELGEQKHRTKTLIDEKQPKWDQEFIINSEGDNILNVTVMDEDELTDDTVGSGTVALTPFMKAGCTVEKFVSIKWKGKPAGKVLLRMTPTEAVHSLNSPHAPPISKPIPSYIQSEDMIEELFKIHSPQQLGQHGIAPQHNQNFLNQFLQGKSRYPANSPYTNQPANSPYTNQPATNSSFRTGPQPVASSAPYSVFQERNLQGPQPPVRFNGQPSSSNLQINNPYQSRSMYLDPQRPQIQPSRQYGLQPAGNNFPYQSHLNVPAYRPEYQTNAVLQRQPVLFSHSPVQNRLS